jgi:aromatic-L-amino-acid decarboxylase
MEKNEGRRLDPEDWDHFNTEMHQLLDSCLNRMQSYRDHPWQPPFLDRLAIRGSPTPSVLNTLVDEIMPTATGNTHPSFWGWVHGAGIPVCVGAELVAATMNSNCGGRNHGAIRVEQACLEWLCQTAGFAAAGGGEAVAAAGGVLTTGTSQATILALCAARTSLLGVDLVRRTGIQNTPPIRVYAAVGAHSCVIRALQVMGHGSDSLRTIPIVTTVTTTNGSRVGSMQLDALSRAIAEDRAQGFLPLAVVGTAGSVGTGAYDALDALADLCQEQNIWFHVDAAFGFWTRIADAPWRDLSVGLERADSIALDAHKWPGVNYDCGACLVADRETLRDTFCERPAYLQSHGDGLAGGDLWFTDYSFELSRGFRALKLWTALQSCGTEALGGVVTDNCRQATLMGRLVEESPYLTLEYPVISNVCIFSVAHGSVSDIATELQLSGQAVFSTITSSEGVPCLRAALVNHRTTSDDVRAAIAAVEQTQKRAHDVARTNDSTTPNGHSHKGAAAIIDDTATNGVTATDISDATTNGYSHNCTAAILDAAETTNGHSNNIDTYIAMVTATNLI